MNPETNPLIKFSQSQGTKPQSAGVISSGDNPLIKFANQKSSTLTLGSTSNAMNSLLGKNAAYAPQTVDDARKLQQENPTAWDTISKNLMKPIGLMATAAEQVGKFGADVASGNFLQAGKDIIDTPGKLGGIITGSSTRSFTDLWQENFKSLGIDLKIPVPVPTLNLEPGVISQSPIGFRKIEMDAATTIGLVIDIAADPLNFITGGLTRLGAVTAKVVALNKVKQSVKVGSTLYNELKVFGLADDISKISLGATKAEQAAIGQRAMLTIFANTPWEKTVIGGARMYQSTEPVFKALTTGIKQSGAGRITAKIFSTKTSSEAFNLTKEHFDNLLDYRKGEVMDEAIDIQNFMNTKMSKEDAIKAVNMVETAGGKSIAPVDEISTLANRLQINLDNLNKSEKSLGLLKTELPDYFPHKLKNAGKEDVSSWQKFKNFFYDSSGRPRPDDVRGGFNNSKTYSTKLESSLKRNYEGTISSIRENFGIDFEDNAAIAYAKRALGSAKAVTSAEFFDSVRKFGKEFADNAPETANWIESGVSELKGLKFPPDIAVALSDYSKSVKPQELNAALRIIDSVQNVWKAQALVGPSYHVRNAVGNVWNNFLAGVNNPQSYSDAMKLQMGDALKFTDDTGKAWDNNLLMKAAKESGVIGEGWYAKDIETALTSDLGGLSWNPLRQNFGLYRGNRALGSTVENNARLAHFIDKLKSGQTIDNAAASVKKYLFDYGDLTTVEKTFFKRIAPFYTWTRKNIPVQLEALIKQPAKFAGVGKTTNAIESQTAKPDEKYLGDYIKDNIGIRSGADDKGNTYYFLLGSWLPAAQAIDFLSQPLENFTIALTPFLKTPVELWANQSLFFEDTFGTPSKLERYPEENQSFLGFTMRKKTAYILKNIRILNELDKINPGSIFGDKDNPSLVNRIAPEAGFRAPFGIGTITTSDKRKVGFTPETSQNSRILQSMFGKLVPYNPQYSKKFYLWDTETKVRELKRSIKDAQRDGQKEYANKLVEKLKEVQRARR